jgi:hypothetical protein
VLALQEELTGELVGVRHECLDGFGFKNMG